MSSISRKKPNSTDSRFTALQKAKNRHDTVPAPQDVLTTATATRLDAIYPLFQAAINDVAAAKAASSASTGTNSPAMNHSAMFISHFIQVFNLGVTRGVYAKEQRAFYGLDVNSANVPDLRSEADVLLWGQRLKDGDPARVTAGGAAMSNPTIAQCNTAYDAFVALNNSHITVKESLDMALEALEALNTEADGVILKVWDEAETFYNEEAAPSKRANCRLWGVVYISKGPASDVRITVLNAAGNTPIEGAEAKLRSVGVVTVTDALGEAVITTHVVGDDEVVVNATGFIENSAPVTIVEGQPVQVIIHLTHV